MEIGHIGASAPSRASRERKRARASLKTPMQRPNKKRELAKQDLALCVKPPVTGQHVNTGADLVGRAPELRAGGVVIALGVLAREVRVP